MLFFNKYNSFHIAFHELKLYDSGLCSFNSLLLLKGYHPHAYVCLSMQITYSILTDTHVLFGKHYHDSNLCTWIFHRKRLLSATLDLVMPKPFNQR